MIQIFIELLEVSIVIICGFDKFLSGDFFFDNLETVKKIDIF